MCFDPETTLRGRDVERLLGDAREIEEQAIRVLALEEIGEHGLWESGQGGSETGHTTGFDRFGEKSGGTGAGSRFRDRESAASAAFAAGIVGRIAAPSAGRPARATAT
ncbi:hypothetical protein GCM10028857_13920 [Salinarchaeum chitinilyticum]